MIFIQCLLASYVAIISIICGIIFIYNKYVDKKNKNLKAVKPPNIKERRNKK